MENLIFYFDLAGTFFFAISGAHVALQYKKLDVYGVGFMALLTAVGGGTLRDILLDAHPIAWIDRIEYPLAIISGASLAYVVGPWVSKFGKFFLLVDSIAVTFAALAGLEKSLAFGANPLTAIMMGVVTATMGGVTRDVVCNELPKVLYTEIYAVAVFLGCLMKWSIGCFLPAYHDFGYGVAYGVIVLLRIVSVRKGWNLKPVSKFTRLRRRNRMV